MKNAFKRLIVFFLICSMFFTSSGFTNLAYATSMEDAGYEEQTEAKEDSTKALPSMDEKIPSDEDSSGDLKEKSTEALSEEVASTEATKIEETTEEMPEIDTTQPSADLRDFAKTAAIAGAAKMGDTYKVYPDKEYAIKVAFEKESSNPLQMNNTQLTYQLPVGFIPAEGQSGMIPAKVNGSLVRDNAYRISGRTVVFDWNKDARQLVASAKNIVMVLTLKGKISENAKVLDFGGSAVLGVKVGDGAETTEEEKATLAGQVNLEDIADSITVTVTEPKDLTAVDRNEALDISLVYSMETAPALEDGEYNTWVYDLKDFISDGKFKSLTNVTGNDNYIMSEKKTAGYYTIQDNKVYLNIKRSWLESHPRNLSGSFDLSLSFDKEEVGSSSSVDFKFPGNANTIHVDFKDIKVESSKEVVGQQKPWGSDVATVTVYRNTDGKYTLQYKLWVKSDTPLSTLHLQDTLGPNQTLKQDSFKIVEGWAENTPSATGNLAQISGDSFTINLENHVQNHKISAGKDYFIFYETDVQEADLDKTLTNSSKWSYDGDKETSPADTTVKINKKVNVATSKKVSKSDDGKEFTWTVTVGDENTDLAGVTVTDKAKGDQKLTGPITVSPAIGGTSSINVSSEWTTMENSGSYTTNEVKLFDYTFPKDAEYRGPFTFTYTTTVEGVTGIYGQQSITNKVDVEGPGGETGSDSANGGNYDFGTEVKPASLVKDIGTWDADSKTVDWTIKVNIEDGATLPLTNVVVTDEGAKYGNSTWDQHDAMNMNWTNATVTLDDGTTYTGTYTVDSANNKITFPSLSSNVIITLHTISPVAFDSMTEYWAYNKAKLEVNKRFMNDDDAKGKYTSGDETYSFDKTGSYSKSDKVFNWTVVINPEGALVPSHDDHVWFTDIIPAGMELVGNNIYVSYSLGFGDGGNKEAFAIETEAGSDGTTVIKPVCISYIPGWEAYEPTFNYGNNGKGVKYTITYQTKLTPGEASAVGQESKTYTNTAKEVKADGTVLKSDDATATYEYSAVTKKDLTDKNPAKDILEYEIKVNPDGLDLDPNSETITVSDVLSRDVELITDQISVEDSNGQPITRARVGYNSSTRTFSVEIPDQTYAIVKFKVVAVDLGKKTYTNSVTLSGSAGYSDETSKEHEISKHSADISGESDAITLTKIDEYDIQKTLSGAEFKLYQVAVNNGALGDETWKKDVTSNEEGKVLFNQLVENKLYYWVETKAPEGYSNTSSEPNYFIMYKTDASAANAMKEQIENIAGVDVNVIQDRFVWTVTNSKDSNASAKFEGTKKLTGRAMTAGEFTFALIPQGDAPMPAQTTVTNEAGNANTAVPFEFGTITYTEVTPENAPYKYTIKEVIPAEKATGVTYDDTEYEVSVVVTRNETTGDLEAAVTYTNTKNNTTAEKAAFENSYHEAGPATAEFTGTKTMSGRAMTAGEFTFELEGNENAPMPADSTGNKKTVTNAAGNTSTFTFGQITYPSAGTYTYTIKEVIPSPAEKATGVTYDPATYTATVVVALNDDGNLAATTSYKKGTQDATAVAFENSYHEAGAATAEFTGTKTMSGRAMTAGEFTFELEGNENAPMPADSTGNKKTVTNAAGNTSTFTFGQITYPSAGTYTYTIKEVIPSPAEKATGVTYDPATYTATVVVALNAEGNLAATTSYKKGTENVTAVTFENSYEGGKSVLISKQDITGDDELEGAHIVLYDKDGNKVDEWDSTTTPHEVNDLHTGEKYTLVETVAPAGYTIATSTFFELNEDGTINEDETKTTTAVENGVLVVNDTATRVTISKKEIAGSDELPGAKIQILDKTGEVVEEWTSGTTPHVIEGKLNVKEEYTLREIVAPDGYAIATDTTFELNEDGTVNSEKTTTKTVGGVLLVEDTKTSVSISKVDIADGAELPGATLQVIKVVDGEEVVVEEWTSDTTPHVIEGKLNVKEEYTLREIVAPNGYAIATDTTFELKEDGTVNTEKTTTKTKDGVLLVEDSKTTKGSLKLKKNDLGNKTPNTTEFVIAGTNYSKTVTYAELKAKGGEITIHDLTPGQYRVTESGAEIAGYILEVTGDTTASVIAGGTATIELTNTYEQTSVSIKKTDVVSGAEVPGAKIQILDSTGEVVEEWTSDSTEHVVKGLLVGETYTLSETVAPEGYAITTDTTFALKADGSIDAEKTTTRTSGGVLLVEDKKTSVSISKKDIAGGPELPGAKLQVIKVVDGEDVVVEEWTSTTKPHVIEGKLNVKEEYILREIVAPEGYAITTDTTFELNEDGTVNTEKTTTKTVGGVLLVEDEKTSVKISKVDVTTQKELPGAHIQVKDSTGNVVDQWDSTDKPHEVKGLIVGETYTLVETVAPTGYDIAAETTFVLDKDGKIDKTKTTTKVQGGILLIEDGKELTSLSGKKTWVESEAGAKRKARPESIKVQLEKKVGSGEWEAVEGKTVEVTAEDGWAYSFTELETYEGTNQVKYRVSEVDADKDYTVSYDNAHKNITNTLKEGTLKITKSFKGISLSDLTTAQKAEITFHITGPGNYDKSVTLDEFTGSSYTIEGLKPGKYVVEETNAKLDAYNLIKTTYSVGDDMEVTVPDQSTEEIGKVTITNEYSVKTTSLEVTKEWDDNDNQDGIRPDKVTVQLESRTATTEFTPVAGKTAELTKANGWKASFTDLPEYDGNDKLVYRISENVTVEGYDTTYPSTNVVRNSHTPGVTTATVIKHWLDNNNEWELRSKEIKVQLQKQIDGSANWVDVSGKEATLNEGNNWSYVFENLPEKEAGKTVAYRCRELTANDNYDISYDYRGNTTDITNTVKTGSLKLRKVFEGDEVTDTDAITFEISSEDGSYSTTVTYKNFNNGFYTIDGLKPGTYIVKETKADITGFDLTSTTYTVSAGNASKKDATVNVTDKVTPQVTVTNEYRELINITGEKTWSDGNNRDGKRPEALKVTLKREVDIDKWEVAKDINGRSCITTATPLEEPDKYVYEFKDVPKYENGKEIVYKVTEETVDGYTLDTDVNGSKDADYKLLNNHKPELVQVPVTKTWIYDKDVDGALPESIELILYKTVGTGEEAKTEEVTRETVKADEKGNWAHTFNDLYKYENGVQITYTVEETPVDNYNTSISGYNVTNTAQRGNLAITKTITGDLDASTLTDMQLKSIKFTVTGPNDFKKDFSLYDFKAKVASDEEAATDENGAKTQLVYELNNIAVGDYLVEEHAAGVDEYVVTTTYSVDDKTVTVEDTKTGEIEITNKYETSPEEGNITVVKNVTVKGKKAFKKSGSFYVALFKDAECTQRIAWKLKEIKFDGGDSASVTFNHLKNGTYYVAETDNTGKALTSKYSPRKGINVTIKGDNKKAVEITTTTKSGRIELTNDYDAPDEYLEVSKEIHVEKVVTRNGVATTSKESFWIGLFEDEELTMPVSTEIVKANPVEVNPKNKYKGSFTGLADGTYYVAETDEAGVPVAFDSEFQYKVSYSVEDGKVVLESTSPQTSNVTVTNDEVVNEISIFKHVTKGGEDLDSKSNLTATFYATIFTDKSLTKPAVGLVDEDGFETDEDSWPIELKVNKGQDSETYKYTIPAIENEKGDTYYVAETDANGKVIGKGFKYDVSYNGISGKKSYAVTFKPDQGLTETVCINNDIPTKDKDDKDIDTSSGSGSATETDSAKTGDDNPLAMYFMLCMAALALGGFSIRRRRREN